VTCLFSGVGHDLKAKLRSGATDEELDEFISKIWSARTDRYSADRLAALNSSNYDPKSHKKIEMISLGG
jgi:cyclic pyranopterin phosphate synthase